MNKRIKFIIAISLTGIMGSALAKDKGFHFYLDRINNGIEAAEKLRENKAESGDIVTIPAHLAGALCNFEKPIVSYTTIDLKGDKVVCSYIGYTRPSKLVF